MFKKQNISNGIVLSFLLLVSVFSLLAPTFLTFPTWASILNFTADFGIVVLGMTLLMIAGEFDLSVGSNFALTGMIFATLSQHASHGIFALCMALLIGAGIGFINGLITLILRIPSFITTLSTMLILRGVVLLFTEGYPITIDGNNMTMELLAGTFVDNLLVSFLWWLVIGVLLNYLLNQTKLGNHIQATGNNPDTAYSVGINTHAIKLMCFTLCGMLAALAGVIQFSHINSLSPTAGEQYELYAIAAAVIGGTSLKGGQGSIFGAALGTLLISTIDSGLIQIGVSTYWFRAFVGVILILAVSINYSFGSVKYGMR
ncbi:ABC transporter permease [Legionella sp. W05-934-2]|jgi:simple sugar transport system permease protein|uniref:ABC transporter permease n=1 Tax=Legionella sp. W05-934-2 TaxID=1198649 RepID=UPI003461C503